MGKMLGLSLVNTLANGLVELKEWLMGKELVHRLGQVLGEE
jgi:hypothetical protein